MRLGLLFGWLMPAWLLCGCVYPDARIAANAEKSLVGASVAGFDLCAGLPTKTERIGPDVEVRSYETSAATNSAVNISFPVIGVGLNLGAGGYCHATFEMAGGHVAALRHAGTTAEAGVPDAVCAPILHGCRDRPQRQVRSGAATAENRH